MDRKYAHLSIENLDEIGAYFGQGDGCYAFDEQHHATAALALQFYEVPFGAVEHTAVDAYPGALLDVNLLGAKVGDAFILSLGYGDELPHLAVWDNDWNVLAVFGAGAVLQEIGALLQRLDILFCGVDED